MSTLQPPHQFLPSLQLKAESFLFCPLPLPVTGVETIQGAITYDGPMDPGFTGVDGNASIQSGLPIATYQAILSPTNFDNATGSVITGTITATTNANGTGVIFNVALAGVPNAAEYVPFVYHVHNLPISADYNCTTSMGHLDPTDRGEYYPCDDTQPKTCQAGDLGGKHGNITMAGTFQTSFLELYLSTSPSSLYFFGDKSIVIHSSNTTRLTCANFTLASTAPSTSSAGPGVASSTAGGSISSSTVTPHTGGAAKVLQGSSFAFIAAATVAFLLYAEMRDSE